MTTLSMRSRLLRELIQIVAGIAVLTASLWLMDYLGKRAAKPAESALRDAIELSAALRFLGSRNSVLLDIREPEQFAKRHLSGAENLPYSELFRGPLREALINKLSAATQIIIFSKGADLARLRKAKEKLEPYHRRIYLFPGDFSEISFANPHFIQSGVP
jgi:rhodanese-related sulfurtransferase